jgi:hypothetical protein
MCPAHAKSAMTETSRQITTTFSMCSPQRERAQCPVPVVAQFDRSTLEFSCSASLIQAWAISSNSALLVGSIATCAKLRHSAALLIFFGVSHVPPRAESPGALELPVSVSRRKLKRE